MPAVTLLKSAPVNEAGYLHASLLQPIVRLCTRH